MIEPIMFVGIGFLVAGLLVIGVIPLVHARAVRLTMKRLEAVTPMSMAEIQADKDQLRAEFAMSTRRLEMSVEQMKTKTTSQLAEIGKKSEAVGRLKLELGDKSASLFAAEAKEQQLNEDLSAAQNEIAAKQANLLELERVLSETRSELGRVSDSFSDASMTGDSQRVELMALRAQVEVLKGQIESYEKETQGLHERITAKTSEIEITNQQLIEERGKTDSLGNRVGELDRGLVAQTTEAEILSRRVQELTAKLDEQGRFLAEREYATDQLRQESSAAQKLEADLRGELSDLEQRRRVVTEGLTAEKTILETQLRQAQDERTKLLADIEKMKREADAAWAAERMENAVMRERINDVAAEVARLTSLLEGPGSTVDAILAEATPSRPTAPTNGNGNGNGHVAAADSKGSLADRIRALQARASRLPQAGRA